MQNAGYRVAEVWQWIARVLQALTSVGEGGGVNGVGRQSGATGAFAARGRGEASLVFPEGRANRCDLWKARQPP